MADFPALQLIGFHPLIIAIFCTATGDADRGLWWLCTTTRRRGSKDNQPSRTVADFITVVPLLVDLQIRTNEKFRRKIFDGEPDGVGGAGEPLYPSG